MSFMVLILIILILILLVKVYKNIPTFFFMYGADLPIKLL